MDLNCRIFDYKTQLAQQRKLFIDCFPENIGTKTVEAIHYYWKFQNFPGKLKSYEYTAYIEDEMVGYYAAIPYTYKIGDKTTPVAMVCDVMTSSKHRGKGIFTELGRFSTNKLREESMPFAVGFPIRKEVIPGHLKVGWKISFSMPLYMKFIRTNSILKNKKIGFLAPLANSLFFIYNSVVKSKLSKKFTVELTTNIENVIGYNDFVKEWGTSVPNSLIKDLSFAIWRYGAPERTYKFLSIKSTEGKMIGFVSLRNILKEKVLSYCILDYMVLPGYEDCHGLINKVLTDYAKMDKIEVIMTMMSKISAFKYQLCKNGFLKSPFIFQFIIKNLTREFTDEELFNEKSWHLMWVDSDDL